MLKLVHATAENVYILQEIFKICIRKLLKSGTRFDTELIVR